MRLCLFTSLVLLAILSAACGANKGAYIAANEAVIDEFPMFPGAVEVSRESMSYSFGDGGPLDPAEGYGTRVTYRVPGGTTKDEVFDFYVAIAGSEWTLRIEEVPVIIGDSHTPQPGVTGESAPAVYGDPIRQLSLCRGESFVGLDPFNVELTHDLGGTFDLYVDHSYAQEGYRTAC